MIVSRDGLYGDVLWRGDQLVTLRQRANGSVVCEADGVVEWARSIAEHDYLMFLTGVVDPRDGQVYATGKTHSPGTVMVLGRDFKQLLPAGSYAGPFPSQLSIGDGEPPVVYVVHDANTYRVYGLDGTLLDSRPIPAQHVGTSQGIRYVDEQEVPVWGDATTGAVFDGRLLHEWLRRGDWVAGQGNSGGVGVVGPNGVNFTVLPNRFAFFPRLAVSGDKVAVLFVHGADVLHEVFTPPYPSLAPEPKPEPKPDPQPEPVMPNWKPFYDFLEPRWNAAPARTPAELHALVGVWHHIFGHTTFGLFDRGGGRLSEDWIVEKQPDGSMVGQDVIVSMGLPTSTVSRLAPRHEPNPQNWRVPPVPVGDGGAIPPPPPQDSPVDLEPLRAELRELRKLSRAIEAEASVDRAVVAELKTFVNDLALTLEALQARKHTVKVGKTWGHSHDATVDPK